jgi:hypothetical protein
MEKFSIGKNHRPLTLTLNFVMHKIPIEENYVSIEVLCKKKNRTTNPWYDNECKIARKSIRDASNESLKYDKINRYKALIKKKKKVLYK